jgi:hypothetical protein
MSTAIYISRNFVEFGPFKPQEVADFHHRGILGELDHVREDGTDDWLYIAQWISAFEAPKAKVTPPAAKKAAAKKAPAKKAAAKKAKS